MSLSPFDAIPEADPAEIETRGPRRRPETVELLGDSSKKRKAVNLNPFERKWFLRHGWQFALCEYKHHISGKKHDIWTIADWLAAHEEHGVLLVQTTSVDGMRHRLRKSEAAPELRVWLAAGGRFEVHGWEKPAHRWTVRRVALVLTESGVARQAVEEVTP